MKMKRLLILLFFYQVGFGNQVEIKIKLNPAGSFSAKSDRLTVEGELKVNSDGFSAKNITLSIDSLETGLSLRNNHMKKNYFEVGKYPKAVLLEATGSQGKFKGKLEVHGVQKEVEGKYRVNEGALETKFSCRLSDFNIQEAKYMGVGVEDEVMVYTTIPVKR